MPRKTLKKRKPTTKPKSKPGRITAKQLVGSLNKLVSKIEEDKARIAGMEASLNEIREELESKTSSVANRLQTGLAEMSRVLQAKDASLAQSQKTTARLLEDLRSLSTRFEAVLPKVPEIENELVRLKGQLEGNIESHSSRLGRLESGLDTARDAVQSIQASASQLDRKVDSLREDLMRILQERIEDWERRIRETLPGESAESQAT